MIGGNAFRTIVFLVSTIDIQFGDQLTYVMYRSPVKAIFGPAVGRQLICIGVSDLISSSRFSASTIGQGKHVS